VVLENFHLFGADKFHRVCFYPERNIDVLGEMMSIPFKAILEGVTRKMVVERDYAGSTLDDEELTFDEFVIPALSFENLNLYFHDAVFIVLLFLL
jgi:hypothetical protein